MNAVENVKKFQISIREAIAAAIEDKVNVKNLILELEENKFHLQMLNFTAEQDRVAREVANAIIPAGHINLKRNGTL